MITNQDISRQFRLYAELLLVHRKDERLSDLLSGASYRIQRLDTEIEAIKRPALQKLFRPEIITLLDEKRACSALEGLDELVQLTPAGIFDMMRIKGLGGKKLAVLWHQAKIDTVEGLLQACKTGALRTIPGFGAKTEQNIISAIDAFNSHADRFHYADLADLAHALVISLRKLLKIELISLCGEVRRQTTTVGRVEILAAVPASKLSTPQLKKIMSLSETGGDITSGRTLDEIPVSIYHTTPKEFYCRLFERTGSESHVNKVLKRIKTGSGFISEAAIYKKSKLPFIIPELREDVAEWEWVRNPKPLIAVTDIKGVVHNHTDWSDGVDNLDSFVAACKRKGFDYVVISDHSKNAHYAGGLKPDKVLRQFAAIDRLNKELPPFKIFKSIECDILVSGELDYDRSLLKQFDLVIVSIHQQLKMSEEKATARLVKAIENPYTTILGHMTGRQLLVRTGYPVNFKKVIDACAANQVVIEINANPYRLDMDWSHIPYAIKKGVMISINPDAHSIHEIDNIRWGVSAARKGGLTREMTWNTLSTEGVRKWLMKRKP